MPRPGGGGDGQQGGKTPFPWALQGPPPPEVRGSDPVLPAALPPRQLLIDSEGSCSQMRVSEGAHSYYSPFRRDQFALRD